MTISEELATVLKQACKEVNSWEPWQRSRDPQGSEERKLGDNIVDRNAHSSINQQEIKTAAY